MAAGKLRVLVSFANTQERNRARTGINNWIATWNAEHPTALFAGTSVDLLFQGFPALECRYICSDYLGIEAAQNAIENDVGSNAYREIHDISTGPA